MEVSGKYLPLIDPLTPFVSSDNDAWSDEVRLRHVTFECQSQGRTAEHHHNLYTREPDGQSPKIEFQ